MIDEEKGENKEEKSPFKLPLNFFKFLFKIVIFLGVIYAAIWGILYLMDNYDLGNLIVGPDGDLENPDDYAQDVNLKLLNLESPGSPYSSGESILIRGSLEADTLGMEEINVDLNCELSGYNGSVEVNPSFLVIPKDIDDFRRSVSCSFEEGIITDRRIESEVAKIFAKFDATSKSRYEVYVLGSQKYETTDNPFLEYGIYPDNLMVNNKMEVEFLDGGPVMIDIFVDEVQPFREGEEYLPLEVTLHDMSDAGYVFSLQELILKLSFNLELSQDEDFCDFEFIGEYEGYNTYGLRQDLIDEKINEVCDEETLSVLRISAERCAEEFKEEISFKCDLITKELYAEEGDFVQNVIIAESDYTFEVRNSIGLEIKKS